MEPQQPADVPACGSSGRSREETQEIREWLRSNGYPVVPKASNSKNKFS